VALFPNIQGPKRTLLQTLGVVTLMGSLSWASVPFYDWFCRVTGFGGMPWTFKPEVREMTLRIGETGLAFYEAHNPTDVPVAGSASYNVAPYEAGAFFDKIACFCFEEQILMPGETVMMPVSFFVDPAIVDDREGKYIHTITLGYTFYEIDLPDEAQQASLSLTTDAQVAIDTQ